MVNCNDCGRFINCADINADKAKFRFEPDSHRGPEINEWSCPACEARERKEQSR